VCEVRLREWAAADAAQRAAAKPHVVVLWKKAWAAVAAVFSSSVSGRHGRVLPMPLTGRTDSMDGAPRTRSSLECPADLRTASETARSSLVLAAASSSTSVTPGAPGTPAVLARALSHQTSRSGQPTGYDHHAGGSSSRFSRQGSSSGSSFAWSSTTGVAQGAAAGGQGAARASLDRGVAWWESRAGTTSIATSTPKASIRPLGLAAFPQPSPAGPAPGPPVAALGTWGTAGSPTEAAAAAAAAGAAGVYHGESGLLSPHHRPSSPSGQLSRHSTMAQASLSGVDGMQGATHMPPSPSYSSSRGSPSADWGFRRASPELSAFGPYAGAGELQAAGVGGRPSLHSSLSAGHR
jgi:hypothetical protein